MRKNSRATICGSLLVFIGIMFVAYACRKQDHINETLSKDKAPELPDGGFFGAYKTSNASVQAAQQYLANQDRKFSFSSQFTDQVGLPRWDKSLVYSAAPIMTESQSDLATVVYIPFVREGQLFVNSTMVVRMTPSDTVYRIIGNWQYAQYGFEDGGTDKWDARDIFNIFSKLDKSVFGYTRYRIKDGRIFGQDRTTGLTVTEQQPNGPTTEDFSLVCTSKTVCITASASTNSTYHTETECTTNTECFLVWTSGGGNNPPGGGSGGGGNGGSGGSGGGPLPPTPCPSTNSYVLDSTSNPCDTTGWVPLLPPKRNPCDRVDSLESNQQFIDSLSALRNRATTETRESGNFYHYTNTGIAGIPIAGRENGEGFDVDITGQIDGFMHNHYQGLSSIFSSSDIFTLVTLYNRGNIINLTSFTMVLVTASGTRYILVIDNATNFIQYAGNITQNGLNSLAFDFEILHGILPGESAEHNERAFLNYIQNSNSGLRLFRGDSTFTNWQSIRLDNTNTVVNQPCR